MQVEAEADVRASLSWTGYIENQQEYKEQFFVNFTSGLIAGYELHFPLQKSQKFPYELIKPWSTPLEGKFLISKINTLTPNAKLSISVLWKGVQIFFYITDEHQNRVGFLSGKAYFEQKLERISVGRIEYYNARSTLLQQNRMYNLGYESTEINSSKIRDLRSRSNTYQLALTKDGFLRVKKGKPEDFNQKIIFEHQVNPKNQAFPSYFLYLDNNHKNDCFSVYGLPPNGDKKYLWSQPTKPAQGQVRLVLQDDGDCVLYDLDNKSIWSTSTSKKN